MRPFSLSKSRTKEFTIAKINRAVVAKVAGGAAVATAIFTAGYEGFKNDVYVDPAGIKTVCVGHAYTGPDGKPLKAGQTFSDDVCSYLLGQDIVTAQNTVKSLVKVPLSAGENLAYTDFVFNVGQGNFARSTVLKSLNAGRRTEACNGLTAWVYGGGKMLPGLVRRREAEKQACLAGNSDRPTPLPASDPGNSSPRTL